VEVGATSGGQLFKLFPKSIAETGRFPQGENSSILHSPNAGHSHSLARFGRMAATAVSVPLVMAAQFIIPARWSSLTVRYLPVLRISPPQTNMVSILVYGLPDQSCRLMTSSTLAYWQPIATNQIGATGTTVFQDGAGMGQSGASITR